MSSKRPRHGIFHRIFALAEQLEPDRSKVFHWLFNTPLAALDSLTPIELIFADRGESVIDLLESACPPCTGGKSDIVIFSGRAATATAG
jgi:hypothetical protein